MKPIVRTILVPLQLRTLNVAIFYLSPVSFHFQGLGHYEYLVIPFGHTNAPAIIQAFINDVLRAFLNSSVFVYLDNITILPRDLKEHQHHVRQVLQSLLENNLFIKAKKCESHTTSTTFLGFIIGPTGIKMEPAVLWKPLQAGPFPPHGRNSRGSWPLLTSTTATLLELFNKAVKAPLLPP